METRIIESRHRLVGVQGVTTVVKDRMDLLGLFRKWAEDADLDFLREALGVLVQGIMEAEVSAKIGAGYGERTPVRATHWNGYRPRPWDTRVGTLDLHIPKLWEGSYFPTLLEPRRRSERALLAVVQQVYVEGVSTRRVDNLVKALGCEGISKSQVSRICQELDAVVEGFLTRPLDGGPYSYLWLDALTQKVREGGRIVNVSVVVATAVNGEGKREIMGMDVGTSEDGVFWLAFLRSLVARGIRACSWWSPMPTRAFGTPSPRSLAGLPGSGAALTSWPTCSPGCPGEPSPGWLPWCTPSTSSPLPRRSMPNSSASSLNWMNGSLRRPPCWSRRSRTSGLRQFPGGALAANLVQQPP